MRACSHFTSSFRKDRGDLEAEPELRKIGQNRAESRKRNRPIHLRRLPITPEHPHIYHLRCISRHTHDWRHSCHTLLEPWLGICTTLRVWPLFESHDRAPNWSPAYPKFGAAQAAAEERFGLSRSGPLVIDEVGPVITLILKHQIVRDPQMPGLKCTVPRLRGGRVHLCSKITSQER
jgi:hypothetical protein